MSDRENRGAESMPAVRVEQRLERALAARPAIDCSPEFVARVMAALPPESRADARVTHYGRATLLGCGVLLAAALALLMVLGTARQPGWLLTLLSLELGLLCLGAGTWTRVLRWPISRAG